MKHAKPRTTKKHSSTRLNPDLAETLEVLCNLTGWSDSKGINTILSAGFGALQQSPDEKLDCQQVKNIRELIKAATVTHQIETSSAETVRRARGHVRHIERKMRASRVSKKAQKKSRR